MFAIFSTAEQLTPSHSVELGFVNRRTRTLGVACMGFLTFIALDVAIVERSLPVRSAAGLIALVAGITSFTTTKGYSLLLKPPFLELRYTFLPRRIPLSDIARCELRFDSGGMTYPVHHPTFILKSGQEISFGAISWPAKNAEIGRRICSSLDEMIHGYDAGSSRGQ